MKKKLILYLLLIAMILLAGCGNGDIEAYDGPPKITNAELKQLTSEFYDFIGENDIELVDFSSDIKKLDKWMNNPDGEGFSAPVYLEGSDAIFSVKTKFKREQSGSYRYYGEMKDNYPDGIGIILHEKDSELSDLCSSVAYIGEFEDGYFHGFGMVFAPYTKMEMVGIFEVEAIDTSKTAALVYQGYFDEGQMDGLGNLINDDLFYAGEMNKNEMEGYGKVFIDGTLLYDGEWKNSKRNGDGTEYFENSKQVKYEGGWKNNQYNGKGTLYDASGNVVYDGKWKNGEYK